MSLIIMKYFQTALPKHNRRISGSRLTRARGQILTHVDTMKPSPAYFEQLQLNGKKKTTQIQKQKESDASCLSLSFCPLPAQHGTTCFACPSRPSQAGSKWRDLTISYSGNPVCLEPAGRSAINQPGLAAVGGAPGVRAVPGLPLLSPWLPVL